MPRVLIAGFTALPGPHRTGVQLRHVVRALVRHHKVDVLVLRRGEQAYVERMGNARVLRVPVPEGEMRGRVDAFRRALRRQLDGADYDVVHFSDGWAGQTVLELAERFKYATVYDAGRSPLTGPLPLDVSVVSELEEIEARCAAAADLVLAPTEPARQYLAALGSPQRVHLVAPGVDVDLFDWDLPALSGPPVILYVGTLSQGRGIEVMLAATAEVVRRCEAELVLVGRSGREFRQHIANRVRDLGLEQRVTFAGVVEHARVPELIARSTVCVCAGAPEITSNRLAIYPTKLLEYMACQRAVVAPRRSSVSLLIRDGQTGLLFEAGQPADLAARLHQVISDSSLRARLARNGYDLIRRAHSASSTRRELRAAYSWLASIAPWSERFAAAEEEGADMDIRLPGPGDTAAGAWPNLASEPADEYPLDSDQLLIEEGTGSGLETQLGDPGGEVTRVEVSPLLGEVDTRSTALYPIDQQKVDDWVVEDVNTRPVEQSGVLGEGMAAQPRAAAKPGEPLTSMDASFVAGEIGGEATDEVALGGSRLAAAGSLLGSLDEEEKTRLFAVPPQMQETMPDSALVTTEALPRGRRAAASRPHDTGAGAAARVESEDGERTQVAPGYTRPPRAGRTVPGGHDVATAGSRDPTDRTFPRAERMSESESTTPGSEPFGPGSAERGAAGPDRDS